MTAEIAVNNSVQDSTGFSPFFLTYGQQISLPINQGIDYLRNPENSENPAALEIVERIRTSLNKVQENLKQAQKKQVRNADTHRREVIYEAGQQVFLSTENLIRGSAKLVANILVLFVSKKFVHHWLL